MVKETYRILTINPGSTSTKIGVFDNEDCISEVIVRHNKDELSKYTGKNGDIFGQKDLRNQLVLKALEENNILLGSIDAVVGRAGSLPPMRGGTYIANDDMIADVPKPLIHGALLGAVIAKEMGDNLNIPSYFVDPTSVDEITDMARITGIPELSRSVIFHALNQKAVSRRCAREMNKNYKDCNFIVAHLGGGISIGAHEKGLVVDVTNATNGEGPFSPERGGNVQSIPLIELCFSGKYSKDEIIALFSKKGGMNAHLGTTNFQEVEDKYLAGDEKAKLVFEAMAYWVAKYIASMSAVLKGNVDKIILTGGLAHSKIFVKMISERVNKIAEVIAYPGEEELLSMVQGVLRVLNGQEEAIVYKRNTLQ